MFRPIRNLPRAPTDSPDQANARMSTMQERPKPNAPTTEAVRSALERLLGSPKFAMSARASRFIRFIVETALDGRKDTLKEYVLGVEVFDRSAAFDPTTDTIVRVEAVKLRKRL